jgi:galactokinase
MEYYTVNIDKSTAAVVSSLVATPRTAQAYRNAVLTLICEKRQCNFRRLFSATCALPRAASPLRSHRSENTRVATPSTAPKSQMCDITSRTFVKTDTLLQFRRRFDASGSLYRAPGRVNLIGEHTDYNDGFVLPAAINFSCQIAIAPRPDRKIVLYSEAFDSTAEIDLDDLPKRPTGSWSDYPIGVVSTLEKNGYRLAGANLYITSDVPLGVGLSSSAAIDVSVGYALLGNSGLPIDRTRLAQLCQRAENEFVGAHVGIMDPFVSCHGRADHAILIDCRSLDFRPVPIPTELNLVICNSMVKHQIGTSGYNTRRAECEEGVRRLSAVLPGIIALRDVTLPQLERHRALLSDVVYRRCRHIITENDRVQAFAAALETKNVSALASLMAESHRSMRDDYEISCPELDIMVALAEHYPGVHGARMTGGGFGGCTINLVAANHTQNFQRHMAAEYFAATGRRPDIYICQASQGAEAISLTEDSGAKDREPV